MNLASLLLNMGNRWGPESSLPPRQSVPTPTFFPPLAATACQRTACAQYTPARGCALAKVRPSAGVYRMQQRAVM